MSEKPLEVRVDTHKTIMASVQGQAYEQFGRAADLTLATRYLFWFKETGDSLRNGNKFTPEQMAQRKALLNLAYQMLVGERNHALEEFFGGLRYREHVAAELQELLDGGAK